MPSEPSAPRLHSLDALRGFDMFWIVGAMAVCRGLAEVTGWGPFRWIAGQHYHSGWNGFTAWDLIFPLFLFIAGVALPYSLTRRLEAGEPRGPLYWRIARRVLALVLLGLLMNGLLRLDFAAMRYPSVLARIGLAYGAAALIVLHSTPRSQAIWIASLLLGYWAALTWIEVPGVGAGVLEPGSTIVGYVDRHLLPGVLYSGDHDPEGILSTIPAIATALLGVQAGHWLRRPSPGGMTKALALLGAGVFLLGAGLAWDRSLPINKHLWTGSFVLYAGGWSLLLLSVFYLVVDVWGWRRWSFFFTVIGMNAITIYVLDAFVSFESVAGVIFADARSIVAEPLMSVFALGLGWSVLYVMYRRRWFLRV
jgi:predicted acyltransferase